VNDVLRLAGVAALVAAFSCAGSATAAVRTDGSIAVDLPRAAQKVGRAFAAVVVVTPADATDTFDSYDFTVTVSAPAAIQIVKATSSFTIPFSCTRGLHSLACKGRVVGGDRDHSTHSQIVILKAKKGGKYRISAKVAIEGDANAANDTASKVVTVKKPPPRKTR
jgi:hypothetical protein